MADASKRRSEDRPDPMQAFYARGQSSKVTASPQEPTKGQRRRELLSSNRAKPVLFSGTSLDEWLKAHQGAFWGIVAAAVIGLWIGTAQMDATSTGSASSSVDFGGGEAAEAENASIEYKLAVIHGDASTEAKFGRILDRIQAGGGVCDREPNREHVADVLVASWEESAKRETLLAWSRALARACS